jgi:hypothetical protein
MADERDDPWEHDPEPTTASGWAALFAETPNYRGLDLGKPSPNYLKLFAPTWVALLGPAPLTPAEQQAADQL